MVAIETLLKIPRRVQRVQQTLHVLVREAVDRRLLPYLPAFSELSRGVAGRHGLEVGGPSAVFRQGGIFPLYSLVGSLDGCNFHTETLWEGRLKEGRTYQYASNREPGYQHIEEASTLARIGDATYDFLISSHCLEHVANPLKALRAWSRVLKPGGLLLVLLPNRRVTFDHRRPATTLAHLVEDFDADRGEDDLTHMDEIVRLHDLGMDVESKESLAEFAARVRQNFDHRSIHHHVFDEETTDGMLDWCGGLEKVHTGTWGALHITAIRRKGF